MVGRHHHHDALKIQVALLLVVMVSPLWIMPLSAPVVSDVVVVMHHDSAVNTAVRTITENVPDVQVVEYGSLAYALTIHRTLGRVVWVSHGSEAGIVAQSHVLSWKAFSRRTELTPGKDIVLACDSAMINQYVSTDSSVVSLGKIDALLSGLITSLVLISDTEARDRIDTLYSKFMKRLIDLFTDPAAPLFLHYTEGGSPPSPSPPPTCDFSYKGIYWDAYDIDPDHEVFYDHPDYTYYYTTMGVGPSLDFTIDRSTCDSHGYSIGGMRVDHVSRATVEFWKAGGVATLIELVIALGIAAAAATAGISIPIAALAASVLALIGFSVSVIASLLLADETGSGWVFYEFIRRGEMRMKIGCSWWLHSITDGCAGIVWPEPCDGHYIRS